MNGIRLRFCLSFFLSFVVPSLFSVGQCESPKASDYQISIAEFPADISVDFGEIARNEESVRVVAIKNLTGERITLTSARTDCSCALGFVKNKETLPNEEMEVRLQVRPSEAGAFGRVITLIGEENSNRRISINIRAKCVPRFTLNPSTIRQPLDGPRTTELRVSAHLGSIFEDPRVDLQGNSKFTAECRKLSDQTLQVILTPRQMPDVIVPSKGSIDIERLTIFYGNNREAVFEIPVAIDRAPEVRPATFYIKPGENIIKFFLFGDFGTSVGELKDARIRVQFPGQFSSVEADWRSERLCVCTASLDSTTFLTGETIGVVQLRLKGDTEAIERRVGSLTIEK